MNKVESILPSSIAREGKIIHSKTLEQFMGELERLLQEEQGQRPRVGYLLTLEDDKTDIGQLIQLAEKLKNASFYDGGNRDEILDENIRSQFAYWTFRKGLDVVSLPGYTDHGESLRAYRRIFTRPTYSEGASSTSEVEKLRTPGT